MNDGGYTATQDIKIKLITYIDDWLMFVEVHKFWWGTCRVGENIDFSRFHDVSGERVSHSDPACIVAQAKIEPI